MFAENSEIWNPFAHLNLHPPDWLSQRFAIWCDGLRHRHNICQMYIIIYPCRRPHWELPGLWQRATKRSTGGFTGLISLPFDYFKSFQLLFLGLFMREPKALTAVSDSHLLVGFTFRIMYSCWSYPNLVTVSDIFFFSRESVWPVPLAETRLHEHPIWSRGTVTAILLAQSTMMTTQWWQTAIPFLASLLQLPNHPLRSCQTMT